MAGGSVKKRHAKPSRSSSRLLPPVMPPPPHPPLPLTRSISSSYYRFRLYNKSSIAVVLIFFFCFSAVLYLISGSIFGVDSPSELYSFEVVNEFPHDPRAFTQGLLYGGNDILFESTGLYGESSVRRVHLQTGAVLSSHKMDGSYFGEGLTLFGERLFQVTWLNNTGFIYDSGNLSKMGMFTHQMNDGWGLTTDGKVIFGSDGSSILYQLNPKTLKVTQKTAVTYKGYEVSRLNELEFINDEVWANVWMSDCIARISPKDGRVLGWILLRSLREGLLSSGRTDIDCLNGIAWDGEKNRLFVTGKLWPKLYEIKLRPLRVPLQKSVENTCLSRY